jgi:hypothetical protein
MTEPYSYLDLVHQHFNKNAIFCDFAQTSIRVGFLTECLGTNTEQTWTSNILLIFTIIIFAGHVAACQNVYTLAKG